MDRWNDVEAIFAEVLERAPAERAAFLATVAARDPEVHREVLSLLDAHEAAPAFFDGLLGKFVAPVFTQFDVPSETPTRMGPYRVVHEVGRGGMSIVFLGTRANGPAGPPVALKLIRSGIDAADRLKRFLEERRILAALHHPHIARVFDGGVLDDGRPYFVMEFVDGHPIDRYCDARRLAVEERLRLFQTVAGAVQYAHDHLVVHRDLKPSNILVTHAGAIKLLDFGIAKVLGGDLKHSTSDGVSTGRRWMTPQYAAPEQIRGQGVTTATDVYQLGVLLYKLLTGHRPYRSDLLRPGELERAIVEDEPTRPSTVVTQTEEIAQGDATIRITPEGICVNRDAPLSVLRRTLAGDLDAILLKALSKEPSARYATAEAFADDVGRFLDGQPVEARRGTVGYWLRKYLLRQG